MLSVEGSEVLLPETDVSETDGDVSEPNTPETNRITTTSRIRRTLPPMLSPTISPFLEWLFWGDGELQGG